MEGGFQRATAPRHGWRGTGLEAEQGAALGSKDHFCCFPGNSLASESQLAFLYSGPDRKGPSAYGGSTAHVSPLLLATSSIPHRPESQ